MLGERDFEAAGLLDGAAGRVRAGRLALLQEAAAAGATLEDMRQADAEGRLAALPVELVFSRGYRYSVRDVLAQTGLSEDFARRNYRSLGLAVPDFDAHVMGDGELEAWRMLKALLDAGVPEESVHELGRLVGRGAAQIADAILEVFLRTFVRPGDTEPDVGLRLAALTAGLEPAIAPLSATPVRLHLRERLRHELVAAARRAGGLPVTQPVAVGFADLVGFTALAASAPADELARVTDRLDVQAAAVADGPVRLVKLIGDAAMFAAPEPEPLAHALAELVGDPSLPPLRAGLAAGEAINHGGDWYGAPVNLASRITAAAPAGHVVADASAAEAVELPWRSLGPHRLKGIPEPVELFGHEVVPAAPRSAG